MLKIITGHKTDSQLSRYINLKADDAVITMHGKPLSVDNAPAGMSAEKVAKLLGQAEETASPTDNVVRVDFTRGVA